MPGCNTAPHKRLQCVLCRPCSYTAHAAKQRTGLYSGVSVNLNHSSVHNTVTTQANYAPPAPRWSTSQRRSTSSACQIPPPRRTMHSFAQPPYYNNVYKGASLLWGSMPDGATHRRPCQPGGVSSCPLRIAGKCWHAVNSTDPAHLLRSQRLHLYTVSPAACDLAPGQRSEWGTLHPAGQSSSRDAAGGAEPLAATAASLFGLSPDS